MEDNGRENSLSAADWNFSANTGAPSLLPEKTN
jgi:hypothetical protein